MNDMWRRLRMWGAKTTIKAMDLSLFPRWVKHAWPVIAFRRLVNEGYRKNSAVWSCVRLWANSFPEPALRLVEETDDGTTLVHGHPLVKLLKRPNRAMGARYFWTVCITYMAVGGDVFLWKERDNIGRVIGLWPLHGGQITPMPMVHGWVRGYEYNPGDDQQKMIIEPKDIIAIPWAPDPLNPLVGLGPLMTCARDVDTDEAARSYVFNLLNNDAVPLTVVTLKEPVGGGRLAELKEQFKSGFGGDKQGEPMFIEGDEASVARLGASLSEIAAEALHNIPESRIAAAFEVPAIMVGLNVGLQRAIQGAPREIQEYWTETVRVPRWRLVADQMSDGLRDDFKLADNQMVEFNLREVAALQEDEDKRRSRAREDYQAGLITMNAALSETNRNTVEGGDIYLVPSSGIWSEIGVTPVPTIATDSDVEALLGVPPAKASTSTPNGVKTLGGAESERVTAKDKKDLAAILEAELLAAFDDLRAI